MIRLGWILCCVWFLFVFSSCAVQFEHCAPRSYKSNQVDCFPMDIFLLTNMKVFVQSVLEKDDLILETAYYQVILAKNQALPGRAILRLKRACGNLACLTPEEEKEFFEIVRVYEAAVRNVLNATHFNWECLMNHAYRSKPWMPAVHWHATPRYAKPLHYFGKVFTDKDFGSRNNNPDVLLSFEERQNIIYELQNAIEITRFSW